MTKTIKMQITWIIVIFLTGIALGFLGVYALQKSMSIKMGFTISPNIRCSIEAQIDSGEYEDIFSNISGAPYISPDWTLDEVNSKLIYRNSLTSSIGSSINFRVYNHTNQHIFVETIVSGETYDSAVIEKLLTTPLNEVVPAVILPEDTSFALKFTQVCKITPTFTNVSFDMTYENNTLIYENSNYYTPIGTNLQAQLNQTTYLRDTILVESADDYTVTTGEVNNGITYNKTTGLISIPANILNNDIEITVHRGYLVTFNSNGGNEGEISRYVIPGTTYGSYFDGGVLPTVTKAGDISTNSWRGKNFIQESDLQSGTAVPTCVTYEKITNGVRLTLVQKRNNANDFVVKIPITGLKANTFYTISFLYNVMSGAYFGSSYYVYSNHLWGNCIHNDISNSGNTIYTCFNTSTYTSIEIGVYGAISSAPNYTQYTVGSIMDLTNFQLAEGNNMIAYEPYIGDITATREIALEQDHTIVAKWA